MGLTYYTICDLRLPPKQLLRKGWTAEHFQTIREALAHYRTLPEAGVKVLGVTSGRQSMGLVVHLPLSSGQDESILTSHYRSPPSWVDEAELAGAVDACMTTLNLRYMLDGDIAVPIPFQSAPSKGLQGKYLWLDSNGEPISAVRWAYVAGRGWVPSRAIHQDGETTVPLILKYHADGTDAQGAYHYLDVTPEEYHLLLQRTLERMQSKENIYGGNAI